jgi:hypothetical protein
MSLAARPFAVVVALVILTMFTGCSGGGNLDESGTADPARRATPPAVPAAADWDVASVAPAAARFADHPAMRAYIRYRNARFKALTTSDQNNADLAATATGLQLRHDRNVISEDRRKGHRLQGRPRWSVVAFNQVSATRAEVDACEWDAAAQVVDSKGVEVSPVSHRWLPVRSILIQEGERWAVSESPEGTFTCDSAR